MITGTVDTRRISRSTSYPSISGSITSRMTASGKWSVSLRSPSCGVEAPSTSNPSSSKSMRITFTIRGSSSITRMVRRGWDMTRPSLAPCLSASFDRQGKRYGRTRLFVGLHPDTAAMGLDDRPADVEAQSGPPLDSGVALVETGETLEHALARLGRNRLTLVVHADVDAAPVGLGLHPHGDRAAGLPVLHRIIKQIAQYDLNLLVVGQDGGNVGCNVNGKPIPGVRGLEPAHQPAHQRGEIHRNAFGGEPDSLDAGGHQQVIDQPAEPVGLLLDHGQPLAHRLHAPFAVRARERTGIAFDDGERRLQLVRDDGDEAAPEHVGVLHGALIAQGEHDAGECASRVA